MSETYDENTLVKVRNALLEGARFNNNEADEAITALQNAGILFRERSRDDGVAVYRSKIVEIEAVQIPTEEELDGLSEKDAEERLRLIGQWVLNNDGDVYLGKRHLTIATLEGDMVAAPGWWIIRGTVGEFYPCRDDVFQAKYERVL